ncbi:MAG: DUF3592 domain-containing protein [Brevinematales bacterium]|nr:DUF3592 domain-containing protein [Brevinematales bacterium]
MKIIRSILKNSDALVVLAAMFLVGLPVIITGFIGISESSAYYGSCGSVEGIVVANKYKEETKNSTSYRPVVMFFTPDGTKIHFTDPVDTFYEEYRVGDKVAVLYPPDDPSNARINSWMRIWFEHAFIIGAGFILIAAGIVISVVTVRKASGSDKI